VNPMDNTPWVDSIAALRAMGESDRALEYIHMARTQFGNERAFLSVELFTLMELDRNDEAGEVLNHVGADSPMYSQTLRAVALAAGGRPEEALKIVERLPTEMDYQDIEVAVAWLALGDRNKAAAIITSLDARPLGPQYLTNFIIHWFGGKLFFDLEWAPNFAARLDEAGIELPRWEHFP
jgi:tetratricopeptide (TPR) repeat protein